MKSEPKRVCIIHSNADISQVRELAKVLRPLQDEYAITLWYSDVVPPGDVFETEFLTFLATADMVLIWVSADLWHDAEPYQWLKQNMGLMKQGAIVAPLSARHVVWHGNSFLETYRKNIIPAGGSTMPMGDTATRDAWFAQVANGIAAKLDLKTTLLDDTKSDKHQIKKTIFWRRWTFWGWLIPVLISLVALFLQIPSFLADDYDNKVREAARDSLNRIAKADSVRKTQAASTPKTTTITPKQQEKTTPTKDRCSDQKPIVEELSGLKGRLTCCYREGDQIVCNIVFTRINPGNLQFCAKEASWVTSYTDDSHQTNKATRIRIGSDESVKCLEFKFREVDDAIEISLIFDNCSQSSKKLTKLKVATSIGNLTFRNIPIL